MLTCSLKVDTKSYSRGNLSLEEVKFYSHRDAPYVANIETLDGYGNKCTYKSSFPESGIGGEIPDWKVEKRAGFHPSRRIPWTRIQWCAEKKEDPRLFRRDVRVTVITHLFSFQESFCPHEGLSCGKIVGRWGNEWFFKFLMGFQNLLRIWSKSRAVFPPDTLSPFYVCPHGLIFEGK